MRRILAMVLCIFLFSSCADKAVMENKENIKIVATVFPAYDWIREITRGTGIEILLIPSNGVDMHSYQPSAKDIVDITSCNLFVCARGEEKAWYDEIAPENTFNIARKNSHGHIDEHSWLSVKNAIDICSEISESLCMISPENEELLKKNTGEYIKELEKLQDDFAEISDSAKGKCIVVADRFPFRHMTDEYGLEYEAAFEGCSAESEISFDTVTRLSDKITELGIKDIFVTEKSDKKIANAVIRNLKDDEIRIKELNSMQSVTEKDIENNISYKSVMQKNLEVLKEALN